MDDQVHRRGDLLADGARGQLEARHEHHRLEARNDVARRVGVDGRERAVVAGVHRLEHVQRLAAAAFADDDAVRAHAQRVADEVADRDGAAALDVRRARLEAHEVRLREAQLGGVLDREDALVVREVVGEDVEEGGLAGTGAAGDDDVLAQEHAHAQEVRHRLGEGPEADEVPVEELAAGELADRDAGADEGERVDDAVHAGAVGEAGVHVGLRLVHAAAERRDDALDRGHHRGLVHERAARELELAAALDEDAVGAVHHDLGDGVVREELLQRAEAERLVEDLPAELRGVHVAGEAVADLGEDRVDLLDRAAAQLLGADARRGEALDVEARDELLVDLALHRAAALVGRRRGRRRRRVARSFGRTVARSRRFDRLTV